MGGYLDKNDHDQTTRELGPSPEAKIEFGAEKSTTFFKMLKVCEKRREIGDPRYFYKVDKKGE